MDEHGFRDYRYERKCVVRSHCIHRVQIAMKLNQACFRERYPWRYVNNLYLDNLPLSSFRDAVDGVRDRCKHRIRWYGQLARRVSDAKLEVKIKRGLLGRKEAYSLPSFTIDKNLSHKTLRRLLIRSALPGRLGLHIRDLDAVLMNRYRRRYFESADGAYRITLDDRLEYYRVNKFSNPFLCRVMDGDNVVVELKYQPEHDDSAWKMLGQLGARVTRNSKFASGVERLYLW